MTNKNSILFRFLTASSLAIMLEVMDFTLYGYTASILADRLLPKSQHALDYVWLIFALGLVCRLLGTLLFGHIADKLGTKTTLSVAIVLMGLSTAGIGCIPTYDQIGIVAAFALVVLRAIQGFSFAPEYNSISNYLSFQKGFDRHYTLACSLTVTFGSIGLALGGWLMTTLTAGSSLDSLSDWHWRVPYIVSGLLLGGLSFYLRLQMDNIKADQQVKLPLINVCKTQGLKLFTCTLLMGLIGILTYSIAGFITAYLQTERGFSLHEALRACSSHTWMLACLTIFSAWLSDRFDQKSIIRLALASLTLISPFSFYFIAHGTHVQVQMAIMALVIILGFMSGPLPAFLSRTFHESHRYTGASISYNFGMAIFGGSTPFVMKQLVQVNSLFPGIALGSMALVTLLLHWSLWPNSVRIHHRVLLKHA